jgi:hypothetical protein
VTTVATHAAVCAATYAATTADLAGLALGLSRADAAAQLNQATAAGLFRRRLLPGFGTTPVYMPTLKAANLAAQNPPAFLRSTATPATILRGLLRGHVIFAAAPGLAWLDHVSHQALLRQHHIPTSGFGYAAIGQADDGTLHIHVPAPLASVTAAVALIGNTAARLLPLLEARPAKLHFIAPAGPAADALRAALGEVRAPGNDTAQALAELDAQIAADGTGAARIRLAGQRAKLAAAVAEAAPHPAGTPAAWLGQVIVMGVQHAAA